MGGVYNLINLHVYHYAGNNPLKYTDPDGKQSGPPLSQQPNNLSPINTPYYREPAYQGMVLRHERTEAVVNATEIASNAFGKIWDKLFLGGEYQKKAETFSSKVLRGFIEAQAKAANMFDYNNDGKYSENEVKLITDYVNNFMLLNYSDQKSLGPYEGNVYIPRLTTKETDYYLNILPQVFHPKN
jgi:hypothetical protein